MRYLRVLAVALAIIAIHYIAYDYSVGHVDATPWDIIHCPICSAYMSTEPVPTFTWESNDIGLYRLICNLPQHGMPHVADIAYASIARRGPPMSLCQPV